MKGYFRTQKSLKRKKPKPRLPIEAVIKLRSHHVTPKKGKKGYNRKNLKKQTMEITREEVQS